MRLVTGKHQNWKTRRRPSRKSLSDIWWIILLQHGTVGSRNSELMITAVGFHVYGTRAQ
jgi:hypothetical protein